MTHLYLYRLTSDTGLAPCVDNGMLSLAVCKGGQIRKGKPIHTGLRYRIGAQKDGIDYTRDDVYVLGTYHNKFLYLAKITNIVRMEEYFGEMSNGRTDNIYELKKGELIRNNRLRKEDIHTDTEQNTRDTAGEYALLSNDFIYLGRDAVAIDIVSEKNAQTRETKYYKGEEAERIIRACLPYKDGKAHLPHEPFAKSGGCCG